MNRTAFFSHTEWILPLNIAVGVHVLVLLCSLYLPDLFRGHPKFADIYTTVNIINVADMQPAPPQQAQQQPEPEPAATTPAAAKDAVSITETPKQPKIAAPKAVSLKPLKRKKKKKIDPPPDNSRQKERDRLEREKLTALQEEKLLAEQARLAREALETERKLLSKTISQPAASSAARTQETNKGGQASSGSNKNLIESQYFASIVNRLHQYWALPENLQKNPDLTAVAVITVRMNGKIANLIFENKSGDRVFDQFVQQAIRAADPLPPIPPALKKQRIEIGLRFKPGSIQ